MSLETAPQTELDAVNMMLAGIDEAPVNSLTAPGVSDVGIAKATLLRTRREVLAKGWHFNREKGVELTPGSVSSKVPIPNNTLRIDGSADETRDVTQRGRYLYDNTDHTLLFTTPVKVDIVYNLAWDDLPEPMKDYIALLAAKRFQNAVLGEGKGRYTDDDVNAAKALVEDFQGDTEDHNILADNYAVFSILNR